MDIIANLLKIMEVKNITPYKIEKDIGIKQATFSAWKKGTQPTLDKFIKLLKYLEVTPNELFGYESITLNENEKEMLALFKKLPEREQIKFIGKLEDKANLYTD